MSSDVLNAGLERASQTSLRSVVDSERSTDKRTAYAERNEARLFALRIVRDPAYQANLIVRARTGSLPPAVETRLMEYAWGKPTERLEIGSPGSFEDLSDLPTGALLEKAKSLTLRVAALELEEASLLETQKAELVAAKLQEEVDQAREFATSEAQLSANSEDKEGEV